MDNSIDTIDRAELRVGTRVDVHTRYEPGRWTRGFNIAAVRPDGYLVRRASDGAVLRETIRPDEVRVVSPVPTGWTTPHSRHAGAIGARSSATNTGSDIGVER